MWRIFNKLFGWDYIVWEDTCTGSIARIYLDGYGNPYYWKYKSIKCLGDMNEITLWLTCKAEKYLISKPPQPPEKP